MIEIGEKEKAGVSEILEEFPASSSMIVDYYPDRELNGLKAIGYWCPNDRHGYLLNTLKTFSNRTTKEEVERLRKTICLPDPKDFIDESWPVEERKIIAGYLDVQPVWESWMGYSACRICGTTNGSQCKSDGKYVFPEGFSHYILNHSVKPPIEFLTHIKLCFIEKV